MFLIFASLDRRDREGAMAKRSRPPDVLSVMLVYRDVRRRPWPQWWPGRNEQTLARIEIVEVVAIKVVAILSNARPANGDFPR